MRVLRGTKELHSSFVVDNHAETQLLSGKAGQFWQSLDDISFLGKDKALMGYIDFSSKYCQIPRFIIVTVTGFSERNRRFLRPTRVAIEIATMDGYSYRVRSIWLLITGVCPMNRSKICESSLAEKRSVPPSKDTLQYVVSFVLLIFQKLPKSHRFTKIFERPSQWIF